MEKNEFLLCSEVIYRINVCRTVGELRKVLLAQLKLIIPYACASIIPIQEDPDSHEIRHGTPFCWPEAFQTVEQRWIEGIDQADLDTFVAVLAKLKENADNYFNNG